MNKIDIISLFYNNENIIEEYKTNIKSLQNQDNYDIYFILICNYSLDNTLNKLLELQNEFNNVIVKQTHNNGCSLGKNLGINSIREDSDYIFFLDSDFVIEVEHIKELLSYITDESKYVSYYGGNIDNKCYVGGTFIKKTRYIESTKENIYLGGGCSIICSKLVKKYNLQFDIYYDPFTLQDVDFSFNILKYTNLTKVLNNETIKHSESQTIKTFSENFYKQQLTKNSIYFYNKHNFFNENIFKKLKDLINLDFLKTMTDFYKNLKEKNENYECETFIYANKKYHKYFENYKILEERDEYRSTLKLNKPFKILMDFETFMNEYDFLLQNGLVNNTKIDFEIVLDLKDINEDNFNKLGNVTKIYVFSDLYSLLLKHILNNKIKIQKLEIEKNLLNLKNMINIKNSGLFVLTYEEKYQQIFDFLDNSNINYLIIEEEELLNEQNCIFIDFGNLHLENLKEFSNNNWIVTNDSFINFEIVNENINGNIICSKYITKENYLINHFEINQNSLLDYLKSLF
jgi:hypothetical protein